MPKFNRTPPILNLGHGQHLGPFDNHNVRRPNTRRRSLRNRQRCGQRAHRVRRAGAQRNAAAAAVRLAMLVMASAAAAAAATAAAAAAVASASSAVVTAGAARLARRPVAMRIVASPTAAQNVRDPAIEGLFSD